MAVVVTGAAGFVGPHVLAALRRTGIRAVGVDRRPGTDLRGDLVRPPAEVVRALRRADAVVHLAGRPGVRDPAPDADHARQRDNVLATAAVLAAVGRDVPVVVASSSSVYGGSDGRPSRETDPLRPSGGYAASKARAEAVCAVALADGRPVTVVRPFTLVGAGQRPDMALARWVVQARTGVPLTVLGGADRRRDLTDVRAAAGALVGLLDTGHRGPVNLGTGRPRTLRDLLDAVARVLGVRVHTEQAPAHPDDPAASWADTALLHRVLGAVPVTDLDAVVAEVAAGLPRSLVS